MHPQDFYSYRWIAESLVDQFRMRYVTVRFGDGAMRRHYFDWELEIIREQKTELWGSASNPFFEIHSIDGVSRRDPTSLRHFISSNAFEFIPEVSHIFDLDRTDTVIVDLDPKDPKRFSFEDTRGATEVVFAALASPGSILRQAVTIEDRKFRFSGNRSFHIYLKLDKPYPFEYLREHVKKSLDVVTDMYPQLSYKNARKKPGEPPKTDFILVDIGALARHRCVRALWSMHSKTGLVCVPVQDVRTFDRKEADPNEILNKGPVKEPF